MYVSFDIDALDPAFAPGTGTPEIGGSPPLVRRDMAQFYLLAGLTTREAQQLIRGIGNLDLNIVGVIEFHQ